MSSTVATPALIQRSYSISGWAQSPFLLKSTALLIVPPFINFNFIIVATFFTVDPISTSK